jgi:hypothetical protein
MLTPPYPELDELLRAMFHALIHAQPMHITYLSHVRRYSADYFLSHSSLGSAIGGMQRSTGWSIVATG